MKYLFRGKHHLKDFRCSMENGYHSNMQEVGEENFISISTNVAWEHISIARDKRWVLFLVIKYAVL